MFIAPVPPTCTGSRDSDVNVKYTPGVLSTGKLRDSPRFPYKAELDHAIVAAINYLGPWHILEAVPLNTTGDDDDYTFPHGWLIPVIRNNVGNTELGFFTTYFLPLAAKLKERSLEAKSTGNQVVCKSYDALQSEREDLMVEVMSGLRKLINKSKEDEECKKEVEIKVCQELPANLVQPVYDGTREHQGHRLIGCPRNHQVLPTHCGHYGIYFTEAMSSILMQASFAGSSSCDVTSCKGNAGEGNFPTCDTVSITSSALFNQHIFKLLPEEQKDFLLAVVPEVNVNIIKMVMAGLGGSPQMVSSTLLALTRILYEFKASISSSLLETIVENLCILLTSKTREVVKAALGFMKVLLSAYPDTVLAPHLKQIVSLALGTKSQMSSLVSQKEDCKHHFRFKAKEIYAKLIKKFGYEKIFGLSPPSIHKVLVNIKKTQERTKKKKKEREEESEEESDQEHFKSQQESMDELLRDTDSEEEGETKGAYKPRDRTQAKLAWLQEGGDIMDFLDPSASNKVLVTKPGEKREQKTKKKEAEFKTAPDGRLIITESNDEEEPEKMAGDDEELNDLLNAIEQASGGGIHRQIVKAKRSAPHDPAIEYRAKKAGGDIKKTGKPDPYVYLPLNFQALNKRKMSDQIRKLNTQRKDTQQEPGYFGCGFCEALNIQQRKQGC
uniref:RRP12 HEAT domain-containing protein n=1 Tax=Magallana gigas TaxID=29159 RepID=A0A8W8IIZ2_MAGGI